MGRPMVRRLVAAGHDVRVLARTADARAELAVDGAQVVSDSADAADLADTLFVCVFSDEQVREVCLDGPVLGQMPSGSVLVVHTTGNPRTVETIAVSCAPRGIDVVDAPVSGGPAQIDAGELTLFVGGAGDVVARIRPVLGAYGNPVLHVGPLGAGQRVKLVNNALFAANIGLVVDAVRLGSQLGVPERVLLDALSQGSAASRALAIAAASGSVATLLESTGEFVRKDDCAPERLVRHSHDGVCPQAQGVRAPGSRTAPSSR